MPPQQTLILVRSTAVPACSFLQLLSGGLSSQNIQEIRRSRARPSRHTETADRRTVKRQSVVPVQWDCNFAWPQAASLCWLHAPEIVWLYRVLLRDISP